LQEVNCDDFYEIQRVIYPGQYFFKDKIALLRDSEDLEKPLTVFSQARVISAKERQVLVKYENFLQETEVVDISRIRLLSKVDSIRQVKVRRINLDNSISKIKKVDQNVSFLGKVNFSDILSELLTLNNNYMDILAVESIKHDSYFLGTFDNLLLANELLIIKLHNLVIIC
jgi:hypothetical protein